MTCVVLQCMHQSLVWSPVVILPARSPNPGGDGPAGLTSPGRWSPFKWILLYPLTRKKAGRTSDACFSAAFSFLLEVFESSSLGLLVTGCGRDLLTRRSFPSQSGHLIILPIGSPLFEYYAMNAGVAQARVRLTPKRLQGLNGIMGGS